MNPIIYQNLKPNGKLLKTAKKKCKMFKLTAKICLHQIVGREAFREKVFASYLVVLAMVDVVVIVQVIILILTSYYNRKINN